MCTFLIFYINFSYLAFLNITSYEYYLNFDMIEMRNIFFM